MVVTEDLLIACNRGTVQLCYHYGRANAESSFVFVEIIRPYNSTSDKDFGNSVLARGKDVFCGDASYDTINPEYGALYHYRVVSGTAPLVLTTLIDTDVNGGVLGSKNECGASGIELSPTREAVFFGCPTAAGTSVPALVVAVSRGPDGVSFYGGEHKVINMGNYADPSCDFGSVMASDGMLLAIGASDYNPTSSSNNGVVFIYERSPLDSPVDYNFVQYFVPESDPSVSPSLDLDGFGTSLAFYDGVLAVGASTGLGVRTSVYFFSGSPLAFDYRIATPVSSSMTNSVEFGYSLVFRDRDLLVVGAPGPATRCIYIYEYDSGLGRFPSAPSGNASAAAFLATSVLAPSTFLRTVFVVGGELITAIDNYSPNVSAYNLGAVVFFAASPAPPAPCAAGEQGFLTGCVPCEPGSVAEAGTATRCPSCPLGTAPDAARERCTRCFAGTYADRPQANCSICPAGTEPLYPEQVVCANCPFDKVSAAGDPSCASCRPGFLPVNGSGQTECERCPENHIVAVDLLESVLYCEPCPPGQRPDASRQLCVKNPEDSESDSRTDRGAVLGGSLGGALGGALLVCVCCLCLLCCLCILFAVVLVVAVCAVALVLVVVALLAVGATGLLTGKVVRKRTRLKYDLSAFQGYEGERVNDGLQREFRELAFADLTFDKKVGEGAFGRVFLGIWRGTTYVAIKELNVTADEKAKREFIHEANVMARLGNHPNVVHFLGAVTTEERFYMVSEFAPNGSLLDVLIGGAQTPARLLAFAAGAAAGVSHLHAEGVVHRDIAARNFLVAKDYTVLVADFGLSRVVEAAEGAEGASQRTQSNVGPVRWMAPESLRNKEYSPASDVYMFGCFLLELTSRGTPPFAGLDVTAVIAAVVQEGRLPEVPRDAAPALAKVMSQCWHPDPRSRPTMAGITRKLREEAAGEEESSSTLDEDGPSSTPMTSNYEEVDAGVRPDGYVSFMNSENK